MSDGADLARLREYDAQLEGPERSFLSIVSLYVHWRVCLDQFKKFWYSTTPHLVSFGHVVIFIFSISMHLWSFMIIYVIFFDISHIPTELELVGRAGLQSGQCSLQQGEQLLKDFDKLLAQALTWRSGAKKCGFNHGKGIEKGRKWWIQHQKWMNTDEHWWTHRDLKAQGFGRILTIQSLSEKSFCVKEPCQHILTIQMIKTDSLNIKWTV